MAAARVYLFLGLAVLSALFGPSHSQTCTTKKFSNNRAYANCTDLPQLGAHLHYTYNASNSSLAVAFTAAPAPGGAWVAWAVNPTGNSMPGCQTLMALKLADGSVVAKTYNVSSFTSVVESKLSFDVWGLSAEASNGTMTVFASLKVPGNATSLTQVWQVGGAVKGTEPSDHPLALENKESSSTLMLVTSGGNGTILAPTPAPPKSAAVPRASDFGLVSGLTLLIGSVIMLL